MVKTDAIKKKYYPDDSTDGTLMFYNWLRQYSNSNCMALNVGAGPTAPRKVKSLRGEVRQVIGIDIDEVVLINEDLDHAFILKNGKFPFNDNSFDLAWGDFVMEHVEDAIGFLKELNRVLKPGASFFFRTPNKYHYVSLVGRMTPHWFHELIANRVRGLSPEAHRPYRTYYRFNDKKNILRY
ncbi:methyltransferase domain-containing protein, partial [Nitrospira defluvii]|nr:methyltransferase domain-containing protein [Nitrospira defluvii]